MIPPWLVVLRNLAPTEQQIMNWMSRARTLETRTRIRRWSRAEKAFLIATLVGVALLVLAPFVTVALLIWFSVADLDRIGVYWWIWGPAMGMSVLGSTAGVISSGLRNKACYADGHISVGRVDQVIEHPGSGDDHTWYDVRISAELPDGAVLRRRVHQSDGHVAHRVGALVRFRHNTLDPDDADDVLLDGFPDANAMPGFRE